MAVSLCRRCRCLFPAFWVGRWRTLCYILLEMHFPRLEERMGALHVFMLGAIAYGFLAVLDWVVNICDSRGGNRSWPPGAGAPDAR